MVGTGLIGLRGNTWAQAGGSGGRPHAQEARRPGGQVRALVRAAGTERPAGAGKPRDTGSGK